MNSAAQITNSIIDVNDDAFYTEKPPRLKMDAKLTATVRDLRAEGFKQTVIARLLGVSQSTVSRKTKS